ncbi:MAG: hypothetical protein KME46_29020 [Brasilonema angustatum HA4187-MV1]|jgi:hypothetical protein|nr:hypothetical protein [Brasilonema angustatum HA4187-MV1]
MTRLERESINFKLPKPLAGALRKVARERKTTATDLVIQGLHHILGDVPGTELSVETRLAQLEEEFLHIRSSPDAKNTNPRHEERLTNLEGKLDALAKLSEGFANRLAQFEGALMQMQHNLNASKSRYKSGGYPYQHNSQPPQLQPFSEQNLALRLNTTVSTLQEKRAVLSQKDFELWTRSRDSSQYAWRFNSKDGLYHPVK